MDWSDRTPEQKAEIVKELAGQGFTTSGIAQRAGTSRGAIASVASRENITIGGGIPGHKKGAPRKPRRKFNPFNGYFVDAALNSRPRAKPLSEKPIGIPLIERTQTQCAYPLWEDGDDHHNCCGLPIAEGAYCKDHAEICYREPYYNGV